MGFIAGMSAVWAGWLLFSGAFVGLGCWFEDFRRIQGQNGILAPRSGPVSR